MERATRTYTQKSVARLMSINLKKVYPDIKFKQQRPIMGSISVAGEIYAPVVFMKESQYGKVFYGALLNNIAFAPPGCWDFKEIKEPCAFKFGDKEIEVLRLEGELKVFISE